MSITVTSTTDSNEAVTAALGDLAKTNPVEETKEVATVDEAKPESEVKDESEVEAKADDAEQTEESESEIESEELDASTDDESKEDQKPKKKGGFQKKLEKRDKKISALEQEREYWRQETLKYQSKDSNKGPDKIETQLDLSGKPKADNYNSHEDFVEALTDWKLDQKLKAVEQKQKDNAVKSEFKSKLDKHTERVTKFAEAHDDWEDVIESVGEVPLTITVQEAFINSEHGPDLMYALAKDPKELKRICSLTPIAAAMALGKIEARFSKTESKSSEKKTTKAPPPISPVRTRGAANTKSIYDSELGQREFEKLRNEQLKQNLRR